MGFNVEGARQAGYSDEEIAAHLAADQGFDLAGATQAGYTPAEVIAELAPAVSLTMSQRVGRQLFGADGENGDYATGILSSLKETLTSAGRKPSEIPWTAIPGEAFETVKRTLAKTVAGAKLQVQEQARQAWAQSGVMEAMPAQTRNVLQNPDFQDTIDREKDILRQMQADEQALAERNPSFAQETALGAAGSLAAAAPAVAVGVTTRNPKLVAATIFAGSQPLSYAESRMHGIEPSAAQRAANIKAAIEVGTEYLPAKALFKTGSPAFQRLQHFLAAEIPGESIATIGQTLTDYLSALPDDVTGQDIIDGLAQGVSQLPQTAATTVAAGGAQVGIVDVLNRAGAGIEARMKARAARRQALRPPRVEAPPVDAPAPSDLPPQPPEAPPEVPPVPPGPPADPGVDIPPAPPAAPPVPPGPAVEPPITPPAAPPEVPAGPPVAPPETPAPPPAQPPAEPPIAPPSEPAAPASPRQRVTTARGTQIETAFEIVDAANLVTSDNPAFPPELQPRERGSRKASTVQVAEMAGQLDPQRLGASPEADRGAPIVGPDNVVESGNGRLMAIRQAYAAQSDRAQAYRQYIEQLTGQSTEGMTAPVLVRRRLTDVDRRQFVIEANESATARMSAAEQARADADILTPELVQQLADGTADFQNPQNAFTRAFIGSLPTSERNALIDADGRVSQQGLTRIKAAVLAKAYGGTDVANAAVTRALESTEGEAANLTAALIAVAPNFLRLRAMIEAGQVQPEADIGSQLAEAIEIVRTKGGPGAIENWLRQADLATPRDPIVDELVTAFYTRKAAGGIGRQRPRAVIESILEAYVAEAQRYVADQPGGGLFGDTGAAPAINPTKVLKDQTGALGARELENERQGQAQGGLFGANGRPREGVAGRGPQALRTGSSQAGEGARSSRAAVSSEGFPGEVVPPDGDVQAARTPGVQKAAAGAAYVGMMNPPGAAAPAISLGTQATGTARTVSPQAEPVRREHIMDLFQRELGLKIYQGKPFKVRGALGYFRPTNFEIRNKKINDLEVAAHEVFHWIDRTYPTIRQLYHRRQFSAELKSVSYDASKLDEGFAEFGRLFMTNEREAVTRTPEFYKAFVAEAKAVGIYGKLSRVQEQMHKWYLQGADARARSKIGEVQPPVSAQLTRMLDRWGDRAIAWGLDHLQAAKVIERETSGGIAADAVNSPYKGLRLLAGARSTANTFLNYGTLEISPRGDFVQNGPGLRQIFEPVADVLDDALAYFVGRRAAELARVGKENLLSRDEIEALLERGNSSPKAAEIRQAFADYQGYVDRLMDFAIQTGIVSAETVELWRSMYQNYVPFYRVAEGLGGGNVSGSDTAMGKAGAIFKRLKGGTGNLRDTWENITLNTAIVVHAGLKNLAKRQLFAQIASSPLGQRYAVKIPTDTHAVPIAMQQVENVLRGMVNEAKTRAMDPNATVADRMHYAQVAQALDVLTGSTNAAGGAALEEIQQQATFFTQGHPPSIPDRDSVLVGGKRVWYQIGDPMLWDMLIELNVYKPLSLAEQALGFGKRVLTRGVTLSPEFQISNILRDTFAAFTLSKAGQIPVVDAVRAFRDIWTESPAYVSFLANGGGFGNALSNETKGVKLRLTRLDRHHVLDLPSKIVDFWDKWGQSFELATRLAEFKRDVAAGYTAREAAYQGREVSSDFAMRGKSELVRLAITSLPFFGARLQGNYKLERELFEKRGRQSWTGERALLFATRAMLGITLPSLLLSWLNSDDEDYKALPEETKNLFWAVKWWGSDALPSTDFAGYVGPTYKTRDAVFILIPKPFEVGALFATLPERLWQSIRENNPKPLADAALFTLVNTFQVDPVPQLVRPAVDVYYRNRYWTGAPIVPFSLQNVEPSEQYRATTARSMIEIGERFNVSPLKLEALVNGYLGTMGQYSIMAADALVSGEGATGDEPSKRLSQYPVFRRFLREQPYSRTAYETRFYELADEVTITVNTMAKMRREGRADKIENYLGQSEKLRLFALGKVASKIGDQARDIDANMRAVRNNPFLSGDQKRLQMDRMQQEQNELFRRAVQALDVPTLEKYRNALEGKP